MEITTMNLVGGPRLIPESRDQRSAGLLTSKSRLELVYHRLLEGLEQGLHGVALGGIGDLDGRMPQ